MRASLWALSLVMLSGNFIPDLWTRLAFEAAMGLVGAMIVSTIVREAERVGERRGAAGAAREAVALIRQARRTTATSD